LPDVRTAETFGDLYQDMILEHSKKPRNFRSLPQANPEGGGLPTPLCGDHFTVFLQLENDEVKDISFEGSGLRHLQSFGLDDDWPASRVRPRARHRSCSRGFNRLVTSQATEAHDGADIGKLVVFSGVFPSSRWRVKCANPGMAYDASCPSRRNRITVSTE